MSEYTVVLSKKAAKQLDKLTGNVSAPILDAINGLSVDPRPHGCKMLVGLDGWRIRIGNYRVIYTIEDTILEVLVVNVGDRKNIYRK